MEVVKVSNSYRSSFCRSYIDRKTNKKTSQPIGCDVRGDTALSGRRFLDGGSRSCQTFLASKPVQLSATNILLSIGRIAAIRQYWCRTHRRQSIGAAGRSLVFSIVQWFSRALADAADSMMMRNRIASKPMLQVVKCGVINYGGHNERRGGLCGFLVARLLGVGEIYIVFGKEEA